MSWVEKIGDFNNLFCYLDDWKSREQIKIQYDLTDAESWHAIKYISKLKSKIIVKQRQGATHRAILFKSNEETLKTILLIKNKV